VVGSLIRSHGQATDEVVPEQQVDQRWGIALRIEPTIIPFVLAT
jgi:hypothetical protein